MATVSAKRLLDAALRHRVGVGAFNITNLEEIEAIAIAASSREAPCIIQVIGPVAMFLGLECVASVFRAVSARYPVPLALHLDHTSDPDIVLRAAEAGFDSVMFDGSRYPLEENIEQTAAIVRSLRSARVGGAAPPAVEGEVGVIAGTEVTTVGAGVLCDPDDVIEFLRATGVDFLAPAIGTVHGFYRTANPIIDFERVEAIEAAIAGAGFHRPLVVHGGTGLPGTTISRLISAGFAKINISTILKKTLIDTTRDFIAAHPREYDPPKLDSAVREAVAACVSEHIEMLRTPPAGDLLRGEPW